MAKPLCRPVLKGQLQKPFAVVVVEETILNGELHYYLTNGELKIGQLGHHQQTVKHILRFGWWAKLQCTK